MPETDNDPSASTASFRAFAQRSEEDVARGRGGTSSNRTIIMVAIAVCALIVIGVLVATL
jgi:hypothetical protein